MLSPPLGWHSPSSTAASAPACSLSALSSAPRSLALTEYSAPLTQSHERSSSPHQAYYPSAPSHPLANSRHLADTPTPDSTRLSSYPRHHAATTYSTYAPENPSAAAPSSHWPDWSAADRSNRGL